MKKVKKIKLGEKDYINGWATINIEDNNTIKLPPITRRIKKFNEESKAEFEAYELERTKKDSWEKLFEEDLVIMRNLKREVMFWRVMAVILLALWVL